MNVRMNIILSLCMLAVLASPVEADQIVVGHIVSPFYNVYRPQTREEIYSSYRALVEKRDGVNKAEARLIAQYEAVMRDLDHGYQVSKPKVTEETSSQWKVRIPSKFSINARKQPPDLIVVIDKTNGKVLSVGEQAGI